MFCGELRVVMFGAFGARGGFVTNEEEEEVVEEEDRRSGRREIRIIQKEMGSSGGEAVVLNVYDMYWTNGWTSSLGIGVYHTGVEVYGREFAYGGHQYDFTGIFEIRPRSEDELGDHYKFKESVVLGMTTFREAEVDAAICHLGSEFRGRAYNLLNKNCNNFAATFGLVLCGKELPPWVNRLAYLAACVPFVEKMVPAEWLSPLAMQQEMQQQQQGGVGGKRD